MKGDITGMIHVLEFECEAPLNFYEHCKKCPRFDDNCPDLSLGVEILRRKKKIDYSGEFLSEEYVDAKAFNCQAPLNYFEKTRKKCGHQGRCREEGLLLALLNGNKILDYSQKTAIQFPSIKRRRKKLASLEVKGKKKAAS
ncbi:MAG: hypothetical protein KJ550_12110 [Proteobacteria bacterium]|nr:hypothetical protein [Desulfobacteraceae bacterium]MBU2521158.1 hypothetical protein [Pseudomonadota bacterium]MBU3981331.1 hypothetical protein [Pseudomonadota bacterium]MBU4014194.1 hypothetical protein [Pseudomonadota bacterium]MBU4067177.1 hypothetical protein [Pseudomonadota bacterium]